jgi:nitrogenase molybdenum-iron protein NifN
MTDPTVGDPTVDDPTVDDPTVDDPTVSVATTNACRMCMPLGACLALAGIEGTMPFLHGGQGCATYIRRYLISHFNEPLDIGSSSFSEASTVFGGESDLCQGIRNVVGTYAPRLVGVATTCLAETIGEDVPRILQRLRVTSGPGDLPPTLSVSTPSYAGTHADGFRAAVAAVLDALAVDGPQNDELVLLPGMVSTADLRHLRELLDGFGLRAVVLPDYADRLDAPAAAEYHRLPPGGTPLGDVARCGSARAVLTLGCLASPGVPGGGRYLAERFGIPHHELPLPIGVGFTDTFVDLLGRLGGHEATGAVEAERGRLVDAYVDGHKYVAGRRAVVFGDEDLVVGLTGFLTEIGVRVVVCASGGRSGRLSDTLTEQVPGLGEDVLVLADADFERIDRAAGEASPDLLVGHSKGYPTARRLGVPLIRVGLPIHDRLGGQRVLHLGYRGAQQLFDRIVNTLIERAQDSSPVGYAYM